MTKMATTPIYGKKKLKKSPEPGDRLPQNLVCNQGLQPIIICSNDDPGLTLPYFMARSNLITLAFLKEKSENSGYFRNYCSQWPENW